MANATKKTPAKTGPKTPRKKTVAKTTSSSKTLGTSKKAVEKAPIAARISRPAASMEVAVYDMKGKSTGTITLPTEVFGASWNADLVHQVVVGMQANARPTVANTKFRGEVSGGGKKPWKQKGTGRARHGSTRSPIWKGGGVTHGPRAERDYSVKINRKMRVAALMSVLSRKHRDGEVLFVNSLSFAEPKTKDARAMLEAIAKTSGMETLATKRKNAAVIAFSKKDTMGEKSFRNIGSLITEEVRNLNVVDLMNKKFLIIENPTDSIAQLAGKLGAKAPTT